MVLDAMETPMQYRQMRGVGLDVAEDRYAKGFWSDRMMQAYCWAWRNGAFRYSDTLCQYRDDRLADYAKTGQWSAFWSRIDGFVAGMDTGTG